MISEDKNTLANKVSKRVNEPGFWKGMALLLFAIIILTQVLDISVNLSPALQKILRRQTAVTQVETSDVKVDTNAIAGEVIKQDGVVLPITWGDLGQQMIRDGVIDEAKFRALFDAGLANVDEQVLTGNVNEPIVMTQENSRFMLDMLWAFGLANKNSILENGEMVDAKYGGDPSKFAATGGWSLAKGPGPDHYSKHAYVTLTTDQQAMVDEVSSNIYRPCCGNSTHFPDCNHGMAMLGLLELMAANGSNTQEMYQVALDVNAHWFPQTYIDLATYFKEQGKDWNEVDPKVVLGAEYSSSQGYQQTRQQIKSLPKPASGGGGCGA